MNQDALKRIDAALAHFGLDDQPASVRAGLKKDFLRNIRRGKSQNPHPDSLRALAKSFGATLDWISGEKNATPPAWAISEHLDGLSVGTDQQVIFEPGMVRLQELDVGASAGPGLEVSAEIVKSEWTLPRELVRAATDTPEERLKIIRVEGDSMEPVFRNMDRVMVDLNKRIPTPPAYFVVWDGLGLVIKHIQYLAHTSPPRVRLTSLKAGIEPYERVLEEAYIQGRVLGKWTWT